MPSLSVSADSQGDMIDVKIPAFNSEQSAYDSEDCLLAAAGSPSTGSTKVPETTSVPSQSTAASAMEAKDVCSMSQEEFDKFLAEHGIDVPFMNQGKKTSRDLLQEVISGKCSLQRVPLHGQNCCQIQRRLKILVAEMQVFVNGQQMFLLATTGGVEKEEETVNFRDTRKKAKQKQQQEQQGVSRERITCTMRTEESPEEALGRCLSGYFGLNEYAAHLDILRSSNQQELHKSGAYWGLTSIYDMYDLHVIARNPEDPVLSVIGLPSGNEFTTTIEDEVARQCTWSWVDGFAYRAVKRKTEGNLALRRPSMALSAENMPAEFRAPTEEKNKKCCVIC